MFVNTSAQSHHSVFAEYDINGSLTIEGIVKEVWFKNPHVRFFVEVTDKYGNLVNINSNGSIVASANHVLHKKVIDIINN